MRRTILLAAVLASCSNPERQAEDSVRNLLGGGSSLEFDGVRKVAKGVCGQVRSKDRVGVVAEWTPFVWAGGRAFLPGDPAYVAEAERIGC